MRALAHGVPPVAQVRARPRPTATDPHVLHRTAVMQVRLDGQTCVGLNLRPPSAMYVRAAAAGAAASPLPASEHRLATTRIRFPIVMPINCPGLGRSTATLRSSNTPPFLPSSPRRSSRCTTRCSQVMDRQLADRVAYGP